MNHPLPQRNNPGSTFAGHQTNQSPDQSTNQSPDQSPDQSTNQSPDQSTKLKNDDENRKTFWQRYRGLIIVLIVLFVVFIAVIVVIVLRRKRSGPSLPPGVKMTQSHAEDFSDKLQQFKDASDEIRREVADLPCPRPLV